MKKLKTQNLNLLFFVLLIAALVYCTLTFLNPDSGDTKADIVSISGWPFSTAWEPGNHNRISNKSGTLTIRLPGELKEDDRLCFYLFEQSAAVYYRSRIFFSKQSRKSDQWVFVPLEKEMSGEELQVYFSYSSVKNPGIMRTVYIGSEKECIRQIRRDTLPGLILCVCTLIIGIVVGILGFYCRNAVEAASVYRHSGVLLILLSLWGAGNLPQLRLSFESLDTLHFLGRVAIMLAPVQLVQIIQHSITKTRHLSWELDCFGYSFCLICAAGIVISYLDILPLALICIWSRILSISFMVYLVLFGVLDPDAIRMRKTTGELRTITSGMSLFSALFYICFEVWFVIGNYFSVSSGLTWGVFAVCAVLLFALLAYVLHEARILLRLQEILAENRMRLMMSQIKPHFMYNTLNSIRTLLRKDPETADELVLQFSKFLRNNLRVMENESMVPFSYELDIVQAYAAIEEICYPRVKVVYEIGPRNFMIPPLSIQPIVENAIRHGILKRQGEGKVVIRTLSEGDCILVEVEDDGIGFQESEIKQSESIGLRNIRSRLEYLCKAELEIASARNEGSCITVRIPKKKGEEEE